MKNREVIHRLRIIRTDINLFAHSTSSPSSITYAFSNNNFSHISTNHRSLSTAQRIEMYYYKSLCHMEIHAALFYNYNYSNRFLFAILFAIHTPNITPSVLHNRSLTSAIPLLRINCIISQKAESRKLPSTIFFSSVFHL